jgi:hypothetical protein
VQSRRGADLTGSTLVVEVLADTAQQHGHWRHVVRYVRPRPDLTGAELDPGHITTESRPSGAAPGPQ